MDTTLKQNNGTPPPLAAWGLAIIFVCLPLLGIHYNHGDLHKPVDPGLYEARFFEFNKNRLHSYALKKRRAGEKVIVGLGTSLFGYVLLGSERTHIVSPDLDNNGHSLFLSIAMSGGTFIKFEPLIEDLLAVKPDILIIHDDLLGDVEKQAKTQTADGSQKTKTHKSFSERIIEIRTELKLLIYALLFRPSKEVTALIGRLKWEAFQLQLEADLLSEQYHMSCTAKPEKDFELNKIKYSLKLYSQPPKLTRKFKLFITELQRGGTQVVMLHLSRHSSLAKMHQASFEVWKQRLSEDIKDQAWNNIIFWETPGSFAAKDYCDYIHFSPGGYIRFNDWLRPRLEKLMAKNK